VSEFFGFLSDVQIWESIRKERSVNEGDTRFNLGRNRVISKSRLKADLCYSAAVQ
jgi:hypothetical protein